jgi:hypothetical protein
VERALKIRLGGLSHSIHADHREVERTALRATREERVHQFLETLRESEPSVPPVRQEEDIPTPGSVQDDAEDADADTLETVFDEGAIISALAQVKQFLETGSPIETLRKRLRKFAQPSAIRNDITEMNRAMPLKANDAAPKLHHSTSRQ